MLSGYESLPIAKYSRGMVQRLGVAQALIGDPELLVFDEPTSGLDPAGRKQVLDLVHALKQAGKTIFFCSHILPEVEQICDRVVIINRGRMVTAGRLDEILGTGDKVEIVVAQISDDAAREMAECGAQLDRAGDGVVRVVVEATTKREVVEKLWAYGCDVVRLNPLQQTLEGVFLKLVGGGR
jgi:ABC-2 type transport system ATP-binding protein